MKKVHTLIDSDFLNYLDYENYKEWCEINDCEPKDENSSDFTEWACREAQECVECDLENLKWTKASKDLLPFFVDGTLGLWNGTREGHCTKIFYGLSAAVENRVCNSDYNDIKVEFDEESGAVEVYGYHHDGTNCFTIHLLSAKGLKAIQKAIDNGSINDYEFETKPEWFKKLKWKEIWG